MLFESKANQSYEELWSDASGSWSCGVLWGGQSLHYTHPTQPTSGPGPQVARLDFTGLDSLVHHYFQCFLAPSTQQAYICVATRGNKPGPLFNFADGKLLTINKREIRPPHQRSSVPGRHMCQQLCRSQLPYRSSNSSCSSRNSRLHY